MNDQAVFTLDLGSSKVAILASTLDEAGKLSVQEISSAPNRGVTRGVITDMDLTREAIAEALKGMRGFGIPEAVVVNIGGAQLEGINAQGFHPIVPAGRAITSADVLSVINHSRQVRPEPDREQIAALPREFKVDGERGITKPIGLAGNRLEVVTHIVTAPIANIRNIECVVESAGIKVSDIIPGPLAVGLALLSDQERQDGAAVVDIGASTTSISVFSNGTLLHCQVLPIGSGSVTSDLSKLLRMAPEEADHLKRKHGRAIGLRKEDESTVEVRQIGQSQPRHLHRKVLFEIIESRMRELATLVGQHLEKSGMRGMLPGGVVVTGGGSLLPGTPQLFAQVLGEPNTRLGTPKVEGPASIRASGPEWSVAVGLAAYVLQRQDSGIEPANGFDQWRERIRTFFLKV